MTKKILFYGNCQIGAISEIFLNHQSLRSKFEVINSSDYNLPNQGF